MPRETVDETAMKKAVDDAHRLTDEELFKLTSVCLCEWLGRRGMPLPKSEEYVLQMFQQMLTDAVLDDGEPS